MSDLAKEISRQHDINRHAKHYRHRELNELEGEVWAGRDTPPGDPNVGEAQRMVDDTFDYLTERGVPWEKAAEIANRARQAWSRDTPMAPGSKFSKHDRGMFIQDMMMLERKAREADKQRALEQVMKAFGARF